MRESQPALFEASFLRPVKQGLVLIIITLILFAVALGIYSARKIFLIFFVGIGLGAVIAPIFPYLKQKYKVPASLAALAVLCFFLLFFTSLLLSLGNLLLVEIVPTLGSLPNILQPFLQKFEAQLNALPALRSMTEGLRSSLERSTPQISQYVLNGLRTSSSFLIYTIFIIAVSIYTAIDPHRYKEGVLNALPSSIRLRTEKLLLEIAKVLRAWSLSQVIVMAGVAIMTAIALLIIEMPNWIAYSVLAGVLNFIPYVGPIVTGAILGIVALAIDPNKALWIVIAFTIIQQIESYLLVPWAMGRIRIPPVYLLAFIFIMGNWFGLLGILMASPFLAVIRIVIVSLSHQSRDRTL